MGIGKHARRDCYLFGVILIPVVGLSTLCSYVVGGMY